MVKFLNFLNKILRLKIISTFYHFILTSSIYLKWNAYCVLSDTFNIKLYVETKRRPSWVNDTRFIVWKLVLIKYIIKLNFYNWCNFCSSFSDISKKQIL